MELGFIGMVTVILMNWKGWHKSSTVDKIWLIIFPIYTLLTMLVLGVFCALCRATRKLNRRE